MQRRVQPQVQEPVVYYVFGNMSYPDTVVLTEDDYFDFLVGFIRNQQRNGPLSMPASLRKAFAAKGLVFLGFHFEDWEFRTLFRGVLPVRHDWLSRLSAQGAALRSPPAIGRDAGTSRPTPMPASRPSTRRSPTAIW